MAQQNGLALFAAVERWWHANQDPLAARGVAATLHGPFEALGMDPIYILHLDGERTEAEAALFRGGVLLLNSFDKDTASKIAASSVDAATEDDLTSTLTSLAERA